MLKTKLQKYIFAIIAVAVVVLFSGCQAEEKQTTATVFAMDTICDITVFEPNSELDVIATDVIAEAEGLITFNGKKSVSADKDDYHIAITDTMYEMIAACKEIYTLSNGKYDPTILPLTELWHVATATEPPSDDEISEAQKKLCFDNGLFFDESGLTIAEEGCGIDMGSAAKGKAADMIAEKLKEYGFESGIINLGGNIRIFGNNPKKESGVFVIAIKDPNEPSKLYATVDVKDTSVVTSGTYERYFEYNGKRYHHIIDPTTGYPCENGVASVTIICDNGLMADILSTAVFVCGKEYGSALLDEISKEYNSVAALIIMEDGTCCTYNTDKYNLKILK